MWFTRVSLKNPVFATMVMLAIVVLGLFSYQRLKIDQFPNIDFPVVVVTAEYPGASPEIVETEVSKKIEEAVNSIAGINALPRAATRASRSSSSSSSCTSTAARRRRTCARRSPRCRPTLRDEVKEPRVLRFDPSSRAIWSLAVLPTPPRARP
jgi:HAE1 family hydrophobic/amphiphilic exporter-1